MQCYDSYGFPNIIPVHSFKTGFHLALWLVKHIMKFPLKRLMKKTHLM